MEPGVPFQFVVYAKNSKGPSEPFPLDGITFRGVAKYTGKTARPTTFPHPYAFNVNVLLPFEAADHVGSR